MSTYGENTMLSPWSLLALATATILFQGLIAAAWMVLGGMGGTWRVNQALARQTDEIQRIDQRISKEVKHRAGVEGRQRAVSEQEVTAEAHRMLGANVAPSGPPSVRHLINGGKG